MSRKSIYETNFDRLVKLSFCDEDGNLRSIGRSKSDGYMDLVFEPLMVPESVTSENCKAFSIAHYFKQNGDLCQDPEMVLIIHPSIKAVEAFSFQMAIPPRYQEVYPEPGKFVPQYKRELNSFLRQWLNNLIDQKHGLQWEGEE